MNWILAAHLFGFAIFLMLHQRQQAIGQANRTTNVIRHHARCQSKVQKIHSTDANDAWDNGGEEIGVHGVFKFVG